MHEQLTIDQAIAAGDQAMTACADRAEVLYPEFKRRAEDAILSHLRVVRECSGEELTDVARARGAVCHDARAFGAVFKSLTKHRLIVVIGYAPRAKGHGSMGAKIYAVGH